MSFYGDLSSIALGDLFQNFEGNRSTGTFTLRGSAGTSRIYFCEGQIAMLAADNRSPLVDVLVSAAGITTKQLEAARARRRGTRKSLGEVLVQLKILTPEELEQLAVGALFEDVCNLLAAADGDFEFKEGKPAPRVFDPEERRLGLRLPIGALLLEAARRSDHWSLIRGVIPSDSVHFVAPPAVECPPDAEDPELAREVLRVLDGTRNVNEVVQLFPQRRFVVYQLLSRFVRERLVRAAETEDLVQTALQAQEESPARARQIIARGLEAEPQHGGLLELEARLAEDLGDRESAAAALKVLAHLNLEANDRERGRELLLRARELSTADTSLWEKVLALDLDDGRLEEAHRTGLALVELYRNPGLHAKAREVLERLVATTPDCVELRIELARSQVDSGDPKLALKELSRLGKRFVSQGRYRDARRLYEEMLAIEPANSEASHCIDLIDNETYERRKRQVRQILRRSCAAAVVFVVTLFLVIEVSARLDYAEATRAVSRERLIESQLYRDAIAHFESVALRHPYSPTSLLDVRQRIDDLKAKIRSSVEPQTAPDQHPSRRDE